MTNEKEDLENRTCKGVILFVDDQLMDKFSTAIELMQEDGYFIKGFTNGDDATEFISGGVNTIWP